MLAAVIPALYTHDMRRQGKVRVWTTTNVENLLRHKGGSYYGRFRVAGKRKLICLQTDVFSVAKLRLHDEAGRVNQQRGATLAVQSGDVTLRDLAKTYIERFESLEITEASKRDRHISLKRLVRSWPGFAELQPKAISAQHCWAWANRLKNEGSGFRPKFSKRPAKKGASGSAVNRSITALQQLLDIAVEIGAVHVNVARLKAPAGYGRLRKKSDPKPVHLPPHKEMQQLLDEIEKPDDTADARVIEAQRSHRLDAGEFCRFMAYCGARQAEAGRAVIGDDRGAYLIVHGTKSLKSIDRVVPINPSLRALLDRIRRRREEEAGWLGLPKPRAADPLLKVKEAQQSITRACKALKLARLTHHDFRHLFATRCLEAGVDPKTIAAWLGHSDGGVLVLRIYGHVRSDHAAAAAAKVVF